MGFETSVFDFYSGFGWQHGAYLLGHAVLLWLLADVSSAVSAVKLRLIVGVFLFGVPRCNSAGVAAWKSFWIPAAANGVPAACLAAAWFAARSRAAENAGRP